MTGATPFEGDGDAFEDGRSSGSGAFDDGRRTGGGPPPGKGGPNGAGRRPRIPLPRVPVEDGGRPLPAPPSAAEAGPEEPAVPAHHVLKSLLGAWALAACSAEEATAVEEHLGGCGDCAEEALRLREAVGLLHRPDSLDLDPGLRTRVLDSCLEHRPPRVPVPEWAAAYDAEAARLDALLQDIQDSEWQAAVRLRWFDGEVPASRPTTVAGVIAHLMSVDGLVAVALGLEDPLGDEAAGRSTPEARTEACWRSGPALATSDVRAPWREQTHALVRTVSRRDATDGSGGNGTGGNGPDDGHGGGGGRGGGDGDGRGGQGDGPGGGVGSVSYGGFALPLRDALLDRAFECWMHAEDIAEAVDYPYRPPAPRHLHGMIDLAARMLPGALAARRRAGLAAPARSRHLVTAGRPGRSLRLEIEGLGGGEWLIPLDSPGAVGSAEHEVAHVALDGAEFCRLAAGHVAPQEAAAGRAGDPEAIRDVLYAAASLSRM